MLTLGHARRNTSTRTESAIGMSSRRTASWTGTVGGSSNPLPLSKQAHLLTRVIRNELAGNLKVSDFGLATVFKYKGQERFLKDRCGSPPYGTSDPPSPSSSGGPYNSRIRRAKGLNLPSLLGVVSQLHLNWQERSPMRPNRSTSGVLGSCSLLSSLAVRVATSSSPLPTLPFPPCPCLSANRKNPPPIHDGLKPGRHALGRTDPEQSRVLRLPRREHLCPRAVAEVGLAGRVGRVAARVEHLDDRAESTTALERYREDGLVPAVSPLTHP